ncbi:VIP peptides [Megalops cyprinoides]|uniref:VIP peptides n=1 Tax=Megalops cyprinoides TaxID=118141 RepID=UPI00186476A5|nr:VIP peptides [Megalops cyprinoides]
MFPRNGSQILLLIALCSVLYSSTIGLPAIGTYSSARPTRHADGLFTSGYSKLLGQLSARRYLESLIGKRLSSDFMGDQLPVKRHSDAVFTDNYSRFRKQMAVKKYLNSVLTGKRSQDDPPNMEEESARIEPSFHESYDDVTVEELLSHLPLTL